MKITVETTKNKAGEMTGIAVVVGKKKHKVSSLDPSVLVSNDSGEITWLTFPEPNGATQHVEQFMKSLKKQPAKHLKSPEHLFAFELKDGAYSQTVYVEPQKEARFLYQRAEDIARAFRATLNNQNK